MTCKRCCKSCRYYRAPDFMPHNLKQGHWCSSVKSPMFGQLVQYRSGCDGFTEAGKRAPVGMRAIIKLNRWISERRKR